MAAETNKPDIKEELQHATSSRAAKTVEKDIKPIQGFFTKFSNDWVMAFSSGLAFNLLTAIFPILIAILSIFGFIVGGLDPSAKNTLITNIQNVFPTPIKSQNILQPALTAINKSAGFLGIIAVITAIIGGSGLFVSMEGYFDIIYHVRPRDVIKQYIMAISMLLFFIIIIPIMVFGALLPAVVASIIPGFGFLLPLLGIVVGLLVSWFFFVVIYIVVPNQRISFRHSWKGAVFAAVAVQIYLILFPFYVTHFLTSDSGTAGFAVILLLFFYYFAVILLIGAEVNAYFGEHIRVTPDNIAVMVHGVTSHLPTSEQGIQEQASMSHKGEEPKDILPRSKARGLQAQASKSVASTEKDVAMQDQSGTASGEGRQKKQQSSSPATSKAGTIIEATAGTALAFVVEFFRIRRHK